MKKIILLVLCAAVTTAGCGYSLAGRGSFLPDYIRAVGIPPLVNATPMPAVGRAMRFVIP